MVFPPQNDDMFSSVQGSSIPISRFFEWLNMWTLLNFYTETSFHLVEFLKDFP